MRSLDIAVQSQDGHQAALMARLPDAPQASLLWMPALGVAARHYIPFAEALAAHGIAVFLHEWRGNGSSSARARRGTDWSYRDLLEDINASSETVSAKAPEMPRIVGGHSLGGQFACMHAALASTRTQAVWLVASGAPYWRVFPRPMRWWFPPTARLLQWLANRAGYMPGRKIGFGGNEAAGVMTDWVRTALSGRYAARGIDTDIEQAMSAFAGDVRALTLSEDWMAPPSSLQFLLSKLGSAHITDAHFSAATIGGPANHFGWMKHSDAIAAWLADGISTKPA